MGPAAGSRGVRSIVIAFPANASPSSVAAANAERVKSRCLATRVIVRTATRTSRTTPAVNSSVYCPR